MMQNRKCMLLFLNIILATFAREPTCPACSQYDFEEKLLERVLRNELVIETMLKDIRETVKVIQEDRSKLEESLNDLEKMKTEMNSEIKGTLQGGLKNMSDSLDLMERMQEKIETKVDDAITTAKINISEAVTDLTLSASITLEQMKKENEILKDQLTIPLIYFHANSPADYSLDSGQVVVYTSVRVNAGQGYDPATGRFTVSVPGLYVFTIHFVVPPSTYGDLVIVHQGTQIQRLYTQPTSNSYASSTVQGFIRADISDQIWVMAAQTCTLYSYQTWNSFTGALMHM